jgi:hypothetical protein
MEDSIQEGSIMARRPYLSNNPVDKRIPIPLLLILLHTCMVREEKREKESV